MLSINALKEKYKAGSNVKTELETLYKKIKDDNQNKNKINAYNTLTEDLAYKQVEENIQGPLQGIFVAVKDNIHVKGVNTTCSSKILENYQAIYNATVVKKLKQAGAIIVGKANMDEFAMGATNTMSAFGVVRNPHNRECVSGGSSGGSTAAVAAGFASVALGSDTGGSIRVPSAYCGVVGLKPTYGSISRYGVMSMAAILDQVGPIASNVEDCALLYSVLAGYDVNDPNSIESDTINLGEIKNTNKKKNIAVIKEFDNDLIDPELREQFAKVIIALKEQGHNLIEVSFPEIIHSIETYFIISRVQGFSALSMIDGIRYGERVEAKTLLDIYKESRGEGFHPEVIKRIMMGNYILASTDYYPKARKVQTLLFKGLENIFNRNIDCIISPSCLSSAPAISSPNLSGVEGFLVDMITSISNLTGTPAISVPIGKDSKNMPLGLQVMGNLKQEQSILELAYCIESIGL